MIAYSSQTRAVGGGCQKRSNGCRRKKKARLAETEWTRQRGGAKERERERAREEEQASKGEPVLNPGRHDFCTIHGRGRLPRAPSSFSPTDRQFFTSHKHRKTSEKAQGGESKRPKSSCYSYIHRETFRFKVFFLTLNRPQLHRDH